jgi:hypothetical protein
MMKRSSAIDRAARASAILAFAGLLVCAASATGATSAEAAAPGASAAGGGVGGDPGAFAARTANGTDTARLHLVHQSESLLYEEGFAAGALPGRMRAWVTVGSLIAGSCTIYTAHGSITGRGAATPHGFGRYQSFSGTFSVTGGSGLYRHAHGRTNLYGTFDRRTFALVVQTTGRLSY